MPNFIVVSTNLGLFVESQDANGVYSQTGPGPIHSGPTTPSNGLGANGDFFLKTSTGDLYKKTSGVYSIITNIRGTAGAAASARGSVWRTGTGAPSNGLGLDGDLYLDVATENVYQKTLGTYALATNISGGGAPGSTWRTGVGAPSNGLGIDGDFYLDTAASNVYEKVVGVYSVQTNINGNRWRTGAGTPSNALGINGDMYLRTATGDVHQKVAGTYSVQANLVGPAGPSGGAQEYAMFFGLTAGTGNGGPNDYAATVAVKTSVGTGRVPFPRDGATSGSIVRVDDTSFTLPAIGKYEVNWKVHTTEPGQLQIELDGVDIAESTTQDMNPTSGGHLMVGSCIVTTTLTNRVLAIVNPAGNTPALTITPADGASTHANAQSLTIKQIA